MFDVAHNFISRKVCIFEKTYSFFRTAKVFRTYNASIVSITPFFNVNVGLLFIMWYI